MIEKEFKEQFIVNFISSYAASIFDYCCDHGQHKRLVNLPIEDARFLADKAWEKYLELV